MAPRSFVSCYLLEPTDVTRRWLRRYVARADCKGWECDVGWHQARVLIEDGAAELREDGLYHDDATVDDFAGDPRWPTTCSKCEYVFSADDHWQLFTNRLYRVVAVVPGATVAVGDLTTLEEADPGAVWFAEWLPDYYKGFDGRAVCVKLPNRHDWLVDSEATNCTRKGDRTHRCWCRQGEPPFLTVGKDCDTCAAGAGSIGSGEGASYYHGFLRAGVLEGD